MFQKYIKVNGRKLLYVDQFCLGGWVFGNLIVLLINWIILGKGEYEIAAVGTLIFVIVWGIARIFPQISGFLENYRLAVMMSHSRKSCLAAGMLWELLNNIGMAVLIVGLYKIEQMFLESVLPDASYELQMDFLMRPAILVSLVLLLSFFGLFMSGLAAVSQYIPYILLIFCCFLPVIFSKERIGGTIFEKGLHSAVQFFQNAPDHELVLLSALTAAVFGALACLLLLRRDA